MVKVSKEFWVSNLFMKDDKTLTSFTFSRSKTGDFPNKVTVSYEIDREVTIKESDLEKLLEPSIGFTRGDVNCLKEVLFGGGENG